MSDDLDQWRAQFAENAGIASPELSVTDAPAEQADTADNEQPRDDQGRYTSKQEEVAAEIEAEVVVEEAVAETETAEPEAAATDDVEAYLAKYGGDTDKALKAAVEAQKLIGRQGAEVGELRKVAEQVEELRALVEQQAVVAAQPAQPSYSADDVQTFLDENPAMAPQLAQRAKEIGDNALYARAMAAWAEIDSAGAMDYAGRIAAWESSNQIREEFAPLLTAAEQQQQARAATLAVEQAAAKHPDFAEVIETVTPDVLDSLHPAIRQDLQTGDMAAKAAALETLYYAARGVQAEKQPQAAAAAAANNKESARQARQDAAVGSATSQSPASRETTSNVDAWREQFQSSTAFRKAAGLTE